MNVLYVIVTWVSLALVVPGLVFIQLPEEADLTTEASISLAILLYCATRLSWMAGQGRPRLLSFTFFLFIYVWIGLAATAQLAVNDFPWQRMHVPEDLLPGILEVALAIAAFEAGLVWARLRPPNAAAPSVFSGMSLAISDRAAVWLSVVAVGLTLLGMYSWGFNHIFITRAQFEKVVAGTLAEGLIARTLLRAPSLVTFTVVAYNALTRWRTFNQERKRFYFLLTLLLGVGLTVLFPYLDLFRHAGSVTQAFDQLDTSESAVNKMIHKPDYDVFQLTLDGYAYGERAGPTWGENFLGAAAFWFPRAYWPTKPYGTGVEVATFFHRSFTNLSAPLWMESYYAFGWLGIGIVLMFYGRICALGETLYERSLAPGAPDSLSRLLVPYWAAFQMFMMRGDLLNAVAYSSFGYLILVGAAVLPRIWGRRVRTGSVPTMTGFE